MKRRSLAGPLAKSIVFILVTVLATTVLGLSIANTGVGETRSYRARFTDATGLIVGDSVRIMRRQGRTGRVHRGGRPEARRGPLQRAEEPEAAGFGDRVDQVPQHGRPALHRPRPGCGPRRRELHRRRHHPALPHHPGPRPHPALQRLPAALRRALPARRQPAGKLHRPGAPGRGRHHRQHPPARRIADRHSRRQGQGDRRGDQEPQHGPEDRQRPRSRPSTTWSTPSRHSSPDSRATASRSARPSPRWAHSPRSRPTCSRTGASRSRRTSSSSSKLSDRLADNSPKIENFLEKTPAKMEAISRLASYGSWLNLYLCEAKVSGVATSDGSTPPTGIEITQPRCLS